MNFAALSVAAALAAALTAQTAMAAPAENARGQGLPQTQPLIASGRGGIAGGPEGPGPEALRRPAISMQTAIDIVRRRTPGRQANVVLEGANYRVRWQADNGRLIDYVIDAQSGVIRSAQGE